MYTKITYYDPFRLTEHTIHAQIKGVGKHTLLGITGPCFRAADSAKINVIPMELLDHATRLAVLKAHNISFTTIKRDGLSNFLMGDGSGKSCSIIDEKGQLRHYTGIGWINKGPASYDDYARFPIIELTEEDADYEDL